MRRWKILRSLSPKFDYVFYLIEESKNIDALSLDELQNFLLVQDQKMNLNSATEEKALKIFTFNPSLNSRGRDRDRGRGRGRGDQRKYFKVDDDQLQGKGREGDQ